MTKLILPGDKDPLPLDHLLNARVEAEGTFCSSLSFTDRQRLRKVVKSVHMKNYPKEMLTDREADKMIEAIAPETARYLIERMWEQVK